MTQTEQQAELEAKGSRDKLRTHLKQLQELAFAAATELDKLKKNATKDSAFKLSYRYADAYLLQIMSNVELFRIVMRKRKKCGDAVTTVQPAVGTEREAAPGGTE